MLDRHRFFFSGFGRLLDRMPLRGEISFHTWNAVFVRSFVSHRLFREVTVWWRRWRRPLKRGGVPRVIVLTLAPNDNTRKEVDDEWDLRHREHRCAIGHENVQVAHRDHFTTSKEIGEEGTSFRERLFCRERERLATVIPATVKTSDPLDHHGGKDHIHGDQ